MRPPPVGSPDRGVTPSPLQQHFGILTLSSIREGDAHRIALSGELDLANVEVVEREVTRVEATGARTIVVDLSGLTWVDSSGVRLLLSTHARSRTLPHRLVLLRAPAEVQRIFELCAVDELLPFARLDD